MKYFKKVIFFSLVYFMSCLYLHAQTVSPPSRMEIYTHRASNDSIIVFNDTLFSSQSTLIATVFLKLQDTLNLAKIHVKLGTAPGGSDIFSKDFLFDVEGSFSDNTSYWRGGFKVLLGIGQFIGLNSYYSEVQLEDTSENLSDVIHYNLNVGE
jgi:hypothetical protein